MRILQTSDWHIGSLLQSFDRNYEHVKFLEWLVDTVAEKDIDAIVLPGDIYDHSNPASSSQNMFYRFVTEARLRRPTLQIITMAGNHDSPTRIEAPQPILQTMGVHVVGRINAPFDDAEIDRLIVPLKNARGEIEAYCIAVPYLRPTDVPPTSIGAGASGFEGASDTYLQGVYELYRRAIERVTLLRTPEQALIATGHCFIQGGEASKTSERPIYVGGSECLPADIFDPSLSYVALGHLHKAQKVDGKEHWRYSGSPLCLSFAEIDYKHQIVIVEFEGAVATSIEPLLVPRWVDFLAVPRVHQPIPEVLDLLRELDLSAYAGTPEHTWPYLKVNVLQDGPEPSLRTDIEAAIKGKPVRFFGFDAKRIQVTGEELVQAITVEEIENFSPQDIFARLYREKFAVDVPSDLLSAFAEIANAVPEDVAK